MQRWARKAEDSRRSGVSSGPCARAMMLAGLLLAASAPLAAGQDAPAQVGPAQVGPAPDAPGPVDGLLERLHLKARPTSAPDFVTSSRPAGDMAFIPVGRPHPARTRPVMTPAEVAAAEADLDAARENQQRQAGHRPAVVPAKPKTAPPGKITVR